MLDTLAFTFKLKVMQMNLLHHQSYISLLCLFSASIIESFLFFGYYTIGLYFSRFDPKLEQPKN